MTDPQMPLCALTDDQLQVVETDIRIAGGMMSALEHLDPVETGGNREVVEAHWLRPTLRGGDLDLGALRCSYRYYSSIELLLRTIRKQHAIFAEDDAWLVTFNAPKLLRLNPHSHYAERKWYDYLRH